MTNLAGQFTELRLKTRCDRCKDERNWLALLTGVDGAKSLQIALCRTPSCHFFEVRSMLDSDAAKPLRERTDRAERATRAWRNATLAAVFAWPVIIFVMMLLG